MPIEINPSRAALAAAADLHCDSLPGSIISMLGPAYALAFYRFAASSDTHSVFVARDGKGQIIGGAVLSLDPTSLSMRLLFQTPLLLHLMRRPSLALQTTWDALCEKLWPNNDKQTYRIPEVVAIFTETNHRNHGVGKELIQEIEAYLVARGIYRYMVRTRGNFENRAINFYEREGFQYIDRYYAHGTWFQLLAKDIKAVQRGSRLF